MLLFLLVDFNIVAFCKPQSVSEAFIYSPVVDFLIFKQKFGGAVEEVAPPIKNGLADFTDGHHQVTRAESVSGNRLRRQAALLFYQPSPLPALLCVQ